MVRETFEGDRLPAYSVRLLGSKPFRPGNARPGNRDLIACEHRGILEKTPPAGPYEQHIVLSEFHACQAHGCLEILGCYLIAGLADLDSEHLRHIEQNPALDDRSDGFN